MIKVSIKYILYVIYDLSVDIKTIDLEYSWKVKSR